MVMKMKTLDQVLSIPDANTRKISAYIRQASSEIQSDILQRLSVVTQTRTAELIGVSGSTVSRFISEDLEKFSLLLSAIEMKVCSSNSVISTPDEFLMIKIWANRYLENDIKNDMLAKQRIEAIS